MTPLPDISHHLPTKEGFCRPDWNAIFACIENHVPEAERRPAWENAARQWVTQLCREFGSGYRMYETANFLTVTAVPEHIARDAGNLYEEALKQILSNLKGATADNGWGKHVVLMFAHLDEYYQYITYYYPEGEHPMTGGVCLDRDGYVHFAFPTSEQASYQTVLVHELTHGCLAHLPIPTWLNEALAMRMEMAVCGSDIFHLDDELYERHVAHWNAASIQTFWTGESWQIPGDSFELSYNLAQVLWRKIEVDLGASREQIVRFITAAEFNDSGEAAFKATFGTSLGAMVADFLGEGEWQPSPEKWTHQPEAASDVNSVDPNKRI